MLSKLKPLLRAVACPFTLVRREPLPKRPADMRSFLQSGTVHTSEFAEGHSAIIFAHQDDDLLWMLPFWKEAKAFIYAALPASDSHVRLVSNIGGFYAQRWTALWGNVSDEEFASTYLNTHRRAQYIHYEAIKARLRAIISRSDIRHIVTHNNWGEYGHVHHRWVNKAVRELAQEYSKDVWAIGIRAFADNTGCYVDTDNLELPGFIYGHFDDSEFKVLRRVYNNVILGAPMWGRRNHSLWTWGGGEFDYPSGRRLFLRLVHNGIDHTTRNKAIHQLEKDVPVIG